MFHVSTRQSSSGLQFAVHYRRRHESSGWKSCTDHRLRHRELGRVGAELFPARELESVISDLSTATMPSRQLPQSGARRPMCVVDVTRRAVGRIRRAARVERSAVCTFCTNNAGSCWSDDNPVTTQSRLFKTMASTSPCVARLKFAIPAHAEIGGGVRRGRHRSSNVRRSWPTWVQRPRRLRTRVERRQCWRCSRDRGDLCTQGIRPTPCAPVRS